MIYNNTKKYDLVGSKYDKNICNTFTLKTKKYC